jgi:two-component system sensor histidine kinase/response regulator
LLPSALPAESHTETTSVARVEDSMTVLLAEDNSVNRKLATRLLEKRGHRVIVAQNGREAIDALAKEPVDLVLMDVQMPVMDGLEATSAIRANEKQTGEHVPIIALTAHAMRGDQERCREAGADDYLSKPIRNSEFLAALDRVRGAKKSRPDPVALGTAGPKPLLLDLQGALDRLDGDRELVQELARFFADECPKSISEIRSALISADFVLLERLAHTLKGSSASVDAESIRQIAIELEMSSRANDLQRSTGLVEGLQNEMDRLMPELKAIFGVVAH